MTVEKLLDKCDYYKDHFSRIERMLNIAESTLNHFKNMGGVSSVIAKQALRMMEAVKNEDDTKEITKTQSNPARESNRNTQELHDIRGNI